MSFRDDTTEDDITPVLDIPCPARGCTRSRQVMADVAALREEVAMLAVRVGQVEAKPDRITRVVLELQRDFRLLQTQMADHQKLLEDAHQALADNFKALLNLLKGGDNGAG